MRICTVLHTQTIISTFIINNVGGSGLIGTVIGSYDHSVDMSEPSNSNYARGICRRSAVRKNKYRQARKGEQYLLKITDLGGVKSEIKQRSSKPVLPPEDHEISEKKCSRLCEKIKVCSLYCWGGELFSNKNGTCVKDTDTYRPFRQGVWAFIKKRQKETCSLYKIDTDKRQKFQLMRACVHSKNIANNF